MGRRSAARPGRSTAPASLGAAMVSSCSCAERPPRRTWSTVWAPIVTVSLAASWRRSSEVSVSGVRRGSRTHLPLLRDGIEGPLDLRHPKRQQVAADQIQVCPDPGRTKWKADVPAPDRQIDLPHMRWPGPQQRSEAIPPETVVVSQDAADHEDSDRHALGLGDRQRVGQVVAVAVIKGHDHSWSARRNRHIGERQRFP